MPGKPKPMITRTGGRGNEGNVTLFSKVRSKSDDDNKKKFNPRTGEETDKPRGKGPRTIYRPKPENPPQMRTGGLSPKQKKIAAKAPPPNKITGADFAVLKKEKAKGRGMGLQDEKVKPGKVMKAREGKMFKGYSKVFETGAEHGAKGKQPSTIVGVKPNVGKKVASKIPGRIGKTLGVVSMLVPAAYAAAKQYKDYKSAKNRDKAKVKKMGGGMMRRYSKGGGADMAKKYSSSKKYITLPEIKQHRKDVYKGMAQYSKGGGADTGTAGERRSRLGVLGNKFKRRTRREGFSSKPSTKITPGAGPMRPIPEKLSAKDISNFYKDQLQSIMRPPSGAHPGKFKSGTMVKAKGCKLGRTRPTKIT